MNLEYILEKSTSIENLIMNLISEAENGTRLSRKCPVVSDQEHLMGLITKTISFNSSGLDYLQQMKEEDIEVFTKLELDLRQASSTFFDNLNSKRRGDYILAISDIILKAINSYATEKQVDHLKDFKELNGRSVFSGDGHYAEHATHTKKINGKYPCFGTIYAQNLRTGLIQPMATVFSETSSKPNELPILRDVLKDFISDNNLNKPVIIYDRACVDHKFWTLVELERENGATIVTRLKKSIVFTFKEMLDIDMDNPMNMGILEYSIVGLSNAGTMYYVKYQDPETGAIYEFISSDKSLQPSTIVFLYKLRWCIEKVYDVFKNKLNEKKAWGTSKVAHQVQAHVIATTYNIICLLQIYLNKNFNVEEIKLEKKRKIYIEDRVKKAKKINRVLHPFETLIPHIFQISQSFIRSIRNAWFKFRSWNKMICIFRESMEKYI